MILYVPEHDGFSFYVETGNKDVQHVGAVVLYLSERDRKYGLLHLF